MSMSGFTAYFQKGIEASQTAEANFRIIRELFLRLNEELKIASEGTLDFFLVDNFNTDDSAALRSIMPDWKRSRIYDSSFIPEESNDLLDSALAVLPHGSESDKPTILFSMNFSLDGLPCSVKKKGISLQCETIDELEEAIGEILSDPEVGRTIYVMMKKSAGDSNSSLD